MSDMLMKLGANPKTETKYEVQFCDIPYAECWFTNSSYKTALEASKTLALMIAESHPAERRFRVVEVITQRRVIAERNGKSRDCAACEHSTPCGMGETICRRHGFNVDAWSTCANWQEREEGGAE